MILEFRLSYICIFFGILVNWIVFDVMLRIEVTTCTLGEFFLMQLAFEIFAVSLHVTFFWTVCEGLIKIWNTLFHCEWNWWISECESFPFRVHFLMSFGIMKWNFGIFDKLTIDVRMLAFGLIFIDKLFSYCYDFLFLDNCLNIDGSHWHFWCFPPFLNGFLIC